MADSKLHSYLCAFLAVEVHVGVALPAPGRGLQLPEGVCLRRLALDGGVGGPHPFWNRGKGGCWVLFENRPALYFRNYIFITKIYNSQTRRSYEIWSMTSSYF